jgi:hypothetical protein
MSASKKRHPAWLQVIALLCVLLVTFGALVQAIHVHSQNSKLSSHECSLCLVAHSGVLTGITSPLDPVFNRTAVVVTPDAQLHPSSFVLYLRIRPPPSA